jgi:formylglycine-generating enzyme required for sulfatase activity
MGGDEVFARELPTNTELLSFLNTNQHQPALCKKGDKWFQRWNFVYAKQEALESIGTKVRPAFQGRFKLKAVLVDDLYRNYNEHTSFVSVREKVASEGQFIEQYAFITFKDEGSMWSVDVRYENYAAFLFGVDYTCYSATPVNAFGGKKIILAGSQEEKEAVQAEMEAKNKAEYAEREAKRIATEVAMEAKNKAKQAEKDFRLLKSKPHIDNAEPVQVAGGCFDMGDTFWVGRDSEKPVHQVCVSDFKMDKYEVTRKAFHEIMGKDPEYFPFKECPYCPVQNVSWEEVNGYCSKVGKRLPTEAEWEYAARSGGKKEKYAGTSNGSEIGEYAWYKENSKLIDIGPKAHPAGEKKPNGLGLYDMSGNVSELLADWYDKNYYKNSPKDNPKGSSGPTDGKEFRVVRGGDYDEELITIRASSRSIYSKYLQGLDVGFRCAQ